MEYIVNSVLNSITYILPVGSQKDCWLIDCGDIEKVIELGWHVRGVLLTHAHFDHIYGLNRLMELFPDALVYTNASGAEGLQSPRWNFSRYHDEVDDFFFAYPNSVKVIKNEGWLTLEDDIRVEVLFTPGHDPSCVSYHVENCLFTGDSYNPGMKTITNFPNSVKEQAEASLELIKTLVEKHGWKICSGHLIVYNS